MEAYKTYQEAKIANPEMDVYLLCNGSGFTSCKDVGNDARFVDLNSDGAKCNPSDYCMTVEQFLADGHKFEVGDLYITLNLTVEDVQDEKFSELMNETEKHDHKRYVLRAKALEKAAKSSNIDAPNWAKWQIGDEVSKIKGSQWKGKVVGYYSTELTPKGYAIESSTEKGSVQIYPEQALESKITEREAFIEDAFKIHCRDELHEAKEVFAAIYDELVDNA